MGRAEPVLPLVDRRQRRSVFGARRRCARPILCAVCWAGTVVLDRQRRAAASAAGTPGRARPVSFRMHPRGWPEDGISTVLPGPVAGRAGAAPADRLRACVQHASLLTKRRGQRPDDPASGSVTVVTRPVALAPRIGRNMGRWLQSQSESGWPDHGPNGVHGRRAEPGASHVPITAGAASRQVQTCTSSNLP